MASLKKDLTPLQTCKGPVRDLFSTFKNLRSRAQSRSATRKNDGQDLRERFKPFNNKFGKKKPKQKIDGEDEAEFK